VEPASASTLRAVPPWSMKVILGIDVLLAHIVAAELAPSVEACGVVRCGR
jgi:hypothetical protein